MGTPLLKFVNPEIVDTFLNQTAPRSLKSDEKWRSYGDETHFLKKWVFSKIDAHAVTTKVFLRALDEGQQAAIKTE